MDQFTIECVDKAETESDTWQHLPVLPLAALKLIGDDNAIKGKIDSPNLQAAGFSLKAAKLSDTPIFKVTAKCCYSGTLGADAPVCSPIQTISC